MALDKKIIALSSVLALSSCDNSQDLNNGMVCIPKEGPPSMFKDSYNCYNKKEYEKFQEKKIRY